MIDMHTHVLPCLDDGAQDVLQAIEIIKQEIKQGVTDIIATPHYNKGNFTSTIEDVKRSYDILKNELEKNNININIHLGHEINMQGDISKLFKDRDFLTLANSRYILLEFNDIDLKKEIVNALYEVRILGYTPIIAHFERCTSVYENTKLLNSILDEEVLIQINSSSILSNNTNDQTKFAKFLLDKKLVSFIASDCHNLSSRKPNLNECFRYIKSKHGHKYAEDLFTNNPGKIISNSEIKYPEYKKEVKKVDLLKFFKL